MKRARSIGLGLVLAGIACNPEQSLSEVLHGKSCREDKRCVEPYVCNADKICVLPFELPDAGGSSDGAIGDLSPAAGAGGAPQAVSTNDGPTVGGEGGAAGSESIAAGAGGVSATDPAVGGADAGCTKVLFRDLDGDGYGSESSAPSRIGCPEPGWVERGDDCFDAIPTPENRADQVHPEQALFFLDGYPGGLPGEVSFDYNCSLQEEGDDPNNSRLGPAKDCSAIAGCAGPAGVVPTDRSGPGVNNLCGSRAIRLCFSPQLNQCGEGPSPPTEFKCH